MLRAPIRQRLILTGFMCALLIVTGIPYAYGYLSAPPGRVFQGIVFNVPDIVQYWSWLRDHRTALLVPNRMTAEPNEPALFNGLWLVLAQIQNIVGWTAPAIYQLLRILGGMSFLIVLWWFIGLCTPAPRERWTAYLIATLGGGFGWIWVVDKYLGAGDVRYPLDLYVVEPNSFFALMALPHLLVAATMILGIFGCFLVGMRREAPWRWYGGAALLALLLGLSHAYDLIMIYAILGVYSMLRCIVARQVLWRLVGGLILIGAVSFPPAGYFTYLTSQNPLWREVLAQFDNAGVFTPNLLHLPVLLGLSFVITIMYGIVSVQRLRRTSAWPALDVESPTAFIWVWTIVGFGLLYIPTDFQIKMLNPYQIPLALLTSRAIWKTIAHIAALPAARRSMLSSIQALAQRRPMILAAAVVILMLPTNVYLLGWRLYDITRVAAPYYLTDDQVAVLRWLDARSDEHAVVLADLTIGQYVPALTGQRAVLAHWAQTVNYYQKRSDVERFFDSDTPAEERAALLRRSQVAYVIYGPEEQALGGYDPKSDPQLQPVLNLPTITIFQVRS